MGSRDGYPEHVVFLVHGLFGSRANWAFIERKLVEHLPSSRYIVHSSIVNEFKKTYEGVDGCGDRLAIEIESLRRRYPSLKEISFIGHSMGGLIARYTAGILYDPTTGLVAGLTPVHYISMATPHLGCDTAHGPAQVPLVRWLNCAGLFWLTPRVAGPFSAAAFKQSGSQFFLADGVESRGPLLWRMARDDASQDEQFLSALRAFETRTAYANQGGDHLVGWANASLRDMEELPKIRGGGLGVVREDPIEAAWSMGESVQNANDCEEERSEDPRHVECSNGRLGDTNLDASGAEGPIPVIARLSVDASASEGTTAHGGRAQRTKEVPTCRSEMTQDVLGQLKSVNWRRIDVSFAESKLSLLSHQHIQTQREWLNRAGREVATHLALQLQAMEELRLRALESS